MPSLVELLRDEEPELWAMPTLLRGDIREAAQLMSQQEARFLVDTYYSVQHFRIKSGNQRFAMGENHEPNRAIDWLQQRFHQLEQQIQRPLEAYNQAKPLGVWIRAQVGLGPVLTAGLLAYLDHSPPPPTVGRWYRFAGVESSVEWLGTAKAQALVTEARAHGYQTPEEALAYCAGATNRRPELLRAWALQEDEEHEPQLTFAKLTAALARRPWHGKLKTLLWKIAQSFVKCSNRPDCLYGKLYKQRKAYEQARNEQGLYADQAAQALKEKAIGKSTEAYKHYSTGHLPPAHIQARAERWAVKIFLGHVHLCAYVLAYGTMPQKPFALERLGHTTYIWPMHTDLIPGLTEMLTQTYAR
jgi:hypothetical protein